MSPIMRGKGRSDGAAPCWGGRGCNLSFLDIFGLCIISRMALVMFARDSVLSALGGIVHIVLCFIGFTILVGAVVSGGRLLSTLCGTTQKKSFSDNCFCACYPSQHLLQFGEIDVLDESWILPACQSVCDRLHHGRVFDGRKAMG